MDIDLTAIMEREGIVWIKRRPVSGYFIVQLENGKAGSGGTVALALESARGPYAVDMAA